MVPWTRAGVLETLRIDRSRLMNTSSSIVLWIVPRDLPVHTWHLLILSPWRFKGQWMYNFLSVFFDLFCSIPSHFGEEPIELPGWCKCSTWNWQGCYSNVVLNNPMTFPYDASQRGLTFWKKKSHFIGQLTNVYFLQMLFFNARSWALEA